MAVCYRTNKGQNDYILHVPVPGLYVYLCQILNSDGKMLRLRMYIEVNDIVSDDNAGRR